MKVTVIIPAAGLGTRMTAASAPAKKPIPSKQFIEIGGTPILIHTLRKFAALDEVSEIVVALREPEIAPFTAGLSADHGQIAKKVRCVVGGERRQDSVSNALDSIHAQPDDIVLVHDAVRPFVSSEIIRDVIHAAQKHGAAIAGVPAIDTVKQVERTSDGALITATLPRERIVMAQTPQGFRFALIQKAFEEANKDGFLGTDEASLVERLDHEVAVVMGSPRNIKITTPLDMELAEFFLKLSS